MFNKRLPNVKRLEPTQYKKGAKQSITKVSDKLNKQHKRVRFLKKVLKTTKRKLAKWGFVDFKTNNKGTIARITTDKFFRI